MFKDTTAKMLDMIEQSPTCYHVIDTLKKELEDNGFIVISTKDLTDVNLKIPKYTMQDNNHPTEEAWNLLTPLIIKKLGLK